MATADITKWEQRRCGNRRHDDSAENNHPSPHMHVHRAQAVRRPLTIGFVFQMPMIVKSSPALLQQAGNLTPLRSRRKKPSLRCHLLLVDDSRATNSSFSTTRNNKPSADAAQAQTAKASPCAATMSPWWTWSPRDSKANAIVACNGTHASCLPRKPSLKSAPSKSLRLLATGAFAPL